MTDVLSRRALNRATLARQHLLARTTMPAAALVETSSACRRPHPDTPAPPRFLPEYDNVLLGHKDRSRIFHDDARPIAQDGVNSIQGSVLVDGLFGAFWNLRRTLEAASLVVRPSWSWSAGDAAAVEDEGRRPLARVAPDAGEYEIVLRDPR